MLIALTVWIGAQTCVRAGTEALNWELEDQEDATCLYGEVTVLDTAQGMSYYAVNFNHGYVGIQHLQEQDVHTTLFSIVNTSPQSKAKILKHGPSVKPGRAEGESDGVHMNLDASWKVGKISQFFLRKQPGSQPKTTDTSFYVADHSSGKWRHVGTINALNGPEHEQETFGGISSLIENYGGEANVKKAKIVLFDLWLGTNLDGMRHITLSGGESGGGTGCWGQLHDQYFIAEGGLKELNAAFTKLESKYGKPVFGKDGEELPHVTYKSMPAELIKELKNLPH